MHRLSKLVATVAVALSVALAPLPSAAAVAPAAEQGAETPDSLSGAAVEAFRAGEYDKAIDLFQRAYTLDPQPNYLFNIGRVYEEKGDLEKAVANYQEFVKQPGVDIEARDAATERLKVLRRTIAALEEDKEPTTGPVDPGVDTPTPAEEAAAAKKRKLRIAGYSLLGVGGATLVIGAVFGGLAIGKSNDAKDAAFVDDKLALRQEAEGRAKVGDGLLITGGVLAAVGLVLVLVTLGKGKDKKNTDTAANQRAGWRPLVAPSLGRSSAGLSFAGRF
jgi:tetratricopeptide (TPR) repeat protein